MRWVKPSVFMIAETDISYDGMRGYLDHIGAGKFPALSSADGVTQVEHLIEIAGRSCYRSFELDMNKNLTKIREGNKEYLGNVIGQKHGSVFEHGYVTFAACDVSRIFTHELVRHRAGLAFSQESGRFIRIDDIGMFLPSCFTEPWIEENLSKFAPPNAVEGYSGNRVQWSYDLSQDIIRMLQSAVEADELVVKHLNHSMLTDHPEMPFHIKKEITSAIRRIVAGGITNNIIFTANHRAIRHMIAMRTAKGAEEEIRQVFGDYENDEEMREVFLSVAKMMGAYFKNIYQDMTIHNDGVVTFENGKI